MSWNSMSIWQRAALLWLLIAANVFGSFGLATQLQHDWIIVPGVIIAVVFMGLLNDLRCPRLSDTDLRSISNDGRRGLAVSRRN